MDTYFIIWVISQQYHLFCCYYYSNFGHWALFQIVSCWPFQHFFFVCANSLLFEPQDTLVSFTFSLRQHWNQPGLRPFSRRLMFTNQDLNVNMLIATEIPPFLVSLNE